jgi:hypothetical protein
MRIAVVALGEPAAERARIERAAAAGAQVLVIAPPEKRAALGPLAARAAWLEPGQEQELAAPVDPLVPSVAARRALLACAREGRLDEVRFDAASAAGWATCLQSRQSDELAGTRLTIELAPADGALAAPLVLGDPWWKALMRDAVRQALRDADAVEGDAAAAEALRAAGWQLGAPRAEHGVAPTPSISVVVTHKDLQQFLPGALASARAQTVPVEIVLVDDGSGPAGLAVVDEEARRDPALKVVKQANAGVGQARNAGVRAASGELVIVLDADNLLRPHFAERLAAALHHRPDVDFAVPALRCFGDDGRTLSLYCPAEVLPSTLFVSNTGGDACAMHRREALLAVGGFAGERFAVEDWDLWLRYADHDRRGCIVPEVLFDYRVRTDSMLRQQSHLQTSLIPFQMAARHPRLLSRYARETALLAAAEHARIADQSEDRRQQLEQAEAAAQQQRAALETQRAELERQRAELERQRGELDRSAAALEQQRAAIDRLERLAAQLRGEVAQQRAASDALRAALGLAQAELEQARAAREEAALQAAGAHARAQQANANLLDQERRTAQALAEAAAREQHVRQALDEMASSSAVRVARMVRSQVPTAQRALGAAGQQLLSLLNRIKPE